MALQQDTRLLGIKTPLGDNAVLLTSFSGTEELSRLFSYQLELVSEKSDIKATDLVGKKVSLKIDMPEGEPRYFSGFISRFQAGDEDEKGRRRYRAEMVPWLWFLTQTADCRIFQNKSIPDIIKQIFQDLGFSDFEVKAQGQHKPWEYCVQYRETDYNFVARLMEQEGLFYFFRHEKDKHTLVIADNKTVYKDCVEKEVEYPKNLSYAALDPHITSWEHHYAFRPGKWAQTDYNFETPTTSLMVKTDSIVKMPEMPKYEIYDYPGEYEEKPDGDADVQIRMEEEEAAHEVVHASSGCRSFSPGGKFKIKKHKSSSEENKTYVITSIHHSAHEPKGYESGSVSAHDYSNTFTCIPDSVTFRPPRITPKPIISGLQTAVVVGPKGEEIFCDEYGRVKVQFHWDREGKKDDKSSCFVRTSQSVAGRQWGFMAIPRIGQEVVVAFLEGDPDRPLITGAVFNKDQMPAYPLPDEKTKSYIKTNSTKGGEGFNELRFEDLKGKEQIFIHAERNYDARVKNDSLERVYGNRHSIYGWEKDGRQGGDLRELIHQDKHVKVERHHVENIGGDMQLLIGGGKEGEGTQEVILKGSRKELIEKEEHLHVKSNSMTAIDGDTHLTIKGAFNEKVGGDQSLTVGKNLQQKSGMKHAMEAGQEIHIKGGMKVIIEAGMQISLVGPGGFVNIGPAGVDIQGIMVKINSGGAAGSGSGCSPQAPKPPEDPKEANPTKPNMADDSKTGKKSS